MNKQEKINELQRITGKGKMACEINMALLAETLTRRLSE